jgi:hypothetical protein
MLASLLLFAQEAVEETEPSKAPYYIAASVLVGFALLLSAIGIRNHETFPPSKAVGRLLTLLCALLVAATMFTAVITG